MEILSWSVVHALLNYVRAHPVRASQTNNNMNNAHIIRAKVLKHIMR